MKQVIRIVSGGAAIALCAAGVLTSAGAAQAAAGATIVHVSQTTADLSDKLTPKQDITLGDSAEAPVQLSLDTSKRYQTIDGFGAAFTDTSTYLLGTKLNEGTREKVLQDLFSRSSGGLGLSFMRVPIGSSDFTATPADAPAPYSYADNNGVPDPTLSSFSIDHDKPYTIPLILEAQKLNPQMRLFANTWSPPAWMKTNQSMIGGGDGSLLPEYSQAYADYYVKFIQAYEQAGIDIWGITPGNEPEVAPPTYPGMMISPDREAALITDNFAPALRAAGLDVKILGGDTGPVRRDYADRLLSDPSVASQLYGTGWHCYAGNLGVMRGIQDSYPNKRTYETECSTGPTGIAPNNAAKTALESLYVGASGVQLWNLALDPQGGPKIGMGCGGCTGLVTVDPQTGNASYTENYYQLGQFSKFIAPEATRVGSSDGSASGSGVWAQAAQNTDGSKVLVAYNTTGEMRSVAVNWDGQGSFKYEIAAGATVTFSSDPTSAPPTQVSITKSVSGSTLNTDVTFTGSIVCGNQASVPWSVTVPAGQVTATKQAEVTSGHSCQISEMTPTAPTGYEWASPAQINPAVFDASGQAVTISSASTLRAVAAPNPTPAPSATAPVSTVAAPQATMAPTSRQATASAGNSRLATTGQDAAALTAFALGGSILVLLGLGTVLGLRRRSMH